MEVSSIVLDPISVRISRDDRMCSSRIIPTSRYLELDRLGGPEVEEEVGVDTWE